MLVAAASLAETSPPLRLPMMAQLNIRVVRLPGLHAPVFYEELLRYNEAHPTKPIYLIQGVEIIGTDALSTAGLYADSVTRTARTELLAASAAVHGDLSRRAGSAAVTGSWTADVSAWTIGFVVGNRWLPAQLQSTDAANAQAPAVRGRYVTSSNDATPSELAAKAARGLTGTAVYIGRDGEKRWTGDGKGAE